jgi:hypothetical protein
MGLSVDAFVLLKEKLDVRVNLEAGLSELFGRRIRLVEEGGFLKPKVQAIGAGDEYDLKQNESDGLKELITLLTFLYDDAHACLIIDESELHQHPQLQTFFLQEMRRLAGDPRTDPTKKCFFLITHSPYFVDIRTTEDLRHCLVFQQRKLPAYVKALDREDEWTLSCLLPRLNTHHKQFFFASRPIFVEGYFDQQLFTLIQEKRGILIGASGSSIIDVSGKNELDLFFRLCKMLKIDGQYIADLDVLVDGNLRRSASKDARCKTYSQEQGLGEDLMVPVGQMERQISACVTAIESTSGSAASMDAAVQEFLAALSAAASVAAKRYVFLIGLRNIPEKLKALIPTHVGTVNVIQGRLSNLISAYEQCGLYLLPNGELENHLDSYSGSPYKVSESVKQTVFKTERDYLLSGALTEGQLQARYADLITILDKVSRATAIDTDKYLSRTIGDWIHKVQSAFHLGEIVDIESLKGAASVEWSVYARILDIVDFSPTSTGFTCTIKLKPSVEANERTVEFHSNTVAANVDLESA